MTEEDTIKLSGIIIKPAGKRIQLTATTQINSEELRILIGVLIGELCRMEARRTPTRRIGQVLDAADTVVFHGDESPRGTMLATAIHRLRDALIQFGEEDGDA